VLVDGRTLTKLPLGDTLRAALQAAPPAARPISRLRAVCQRAAVLSASKRRGSSCGGRRRARPTRSLRAYRAMTGYVVCPGRRGPRLCDRSARAMVETARTPGAGASMRSAPRASRLGRACLESADSCGKACFAAIPEFPNLKPGEPQDVLSCAVSPLKTRAGYRGEDTFIIEPSQTGRQRTSFTRRRDGKESSKQAQTECGIHEAGAAEPRALEVVGAKPIPRTEVTKKLWAYIKKNGLQDKKTNDDQVG